MLKDFPQHFWGTDIESELQILSAIAAAEDAGKNGDITSSALVPSDAGGAAAFHARQNGVIAGIAAVNTIIAAVDKDLIWKPAMKDGTAVKSGDTIGTLIGSARTLLRAERLVLNFMSKLSGIATLTRQYADAVAGTNAKIYDTRKTTPGWRLLEKYAVVCGGGHNHRTGLFDSVLIKDNHLAFGKSGKNNSSGQYTPAEAVQKAKEYVKSIGLQKTALIEIEVDTLEQLRGVLPENPDIVLLDNMKAEQIAEAVRIRNDVSPSVELEASGGVNLKTVRSIAETGIERISAGALTHSAVALDIGLDWDF
ncbi:nicotinate-nucleotide diphosphorylase (carboxylating) [Planctomycetales bacterium]|nr:nicotinate-nucleotide diphosphorylase (carboxylating) [Planctomycetales bacterium]